MPQKHSLHDQSDDLGPECGCPLTCVLLRPRPAQGRRKSACDASSNVPHTCSVIWWHSVVHLMSCFSARCSFRSLQRCLCTLSCSSAVPTSFGTPLIVLRLLECDSVEFMSSARVSHGGRMMSAHFVVNLYHADYALLQPLCGAGFANK